MGVLAGASSNIVLGTIAGITIFLGLPIAKWKNASAQVKGLLTLAAAGVLIFLIIEVGHHAIEIVESSAKSGLYLQTILEAAILGIGLFAGLVGLGWLEENRSSKKAQGASPIEIANMIAIGIGLHNFAEGLAIGQSYSAGQTTLGLVLVIGFALHNATEGFGIAGPLVGLDISWSKLIGLGLIAGAPTAFGALLGGLFVNEKIELLFLSLAAGSLIYVVRELLRLKFASLTTSKALSALTVGLLVGIATEVFVEVASARNAQMAPVPIAAQTITFKDNGTVPDKVQVKRGDSLVLVNETDKSLEFEGHGLMAQEAFVPAGGQLAIKVTGSQGTYRLQPEGDLAIAVSVTVLSGKASALENEIQAVAAVTSLEGHARAAYDLHLRALSGTSPNAALDFKRAGKHAHHPMHELLEDNGPKAILVQEFLKKYNLLEPLTEKLHHYSQLAADKNVGESEFTSCFKDLVATAEQARESIGRQAYKTDYFRKKAVLGVLGMAEDEYKEATENGKIEVLEPAVPGKDEFLEYQDTRGFLKACHESLINGFENILSPDAQAAFSTLLDKHFKTIDPVDPKHPTPFHTIEELFERIEKSIS